MGSNGNHLPGIEHQAIWKMRGNRSENCLAATYMELRLTRSQQLLKHSDKSVAEVALACGFISQPHFTECYSRRFGVTPGKTKDVENT